MTRPDGFALPVAFCHRCGRERVVYRDLVDDGGEGLGTFCVDCETRLDVWGMKPQVRARPFDTLRDEGYELLDPERRQGGGCGPGGCAHKGTRPV